MSNLLMTDYVGRNRLGFAYVQFYLISYGRGGSVFTWFRTILQQRKERLDKLQIDVLRAMASSQKPLTAECIYEQVWEAEVHDWLHIQRMRPGRRLLRQTLREMRNRGLIENFWLSQVDANGRRLPARYVLTSKGGAAVKTLKENIGPRVGFEGALW